MKLTPDLRLEIHQVLASTSLSTGLPATVAAFLADRVSIYDRKAAGAAKSRVARSGCSQEVAATIRQAQEEALRDWRRTHTLPVPAADMAGFVQNWIRRDPSQYDFTKTPARSRIEVALSESERGGAGARLIPPST